MPLRDWVQNAFVIVAVYATLGVAFYWLGNVNEQVSLYNSDLHSNRTECLEYLESVCRHGRSFEKKKCYDCEAVIRQWIWMRVVLFALEELVPISRVGKRLVVYAFEAIVLMAVLGYAVHVGLRVYHKNYSSVLRWRAQIAEQQRLFDWAHGPEAGRLLTAAPAPTEAVVQEMPHDAPWAIAHRE